MKKKVIKSRDFNIALNQTMEINLNTRSIKSKKLYNRKMKHKNASFC
jgi:phage anti-repressor protein